MKQIDVLDKIIFVNETNGDFSYYKEDVLDNSSPNIEEYIKSFNTKHLTICINISNACNLACKYCFNNFKKNKLMDFDYIQRKIIQLVNDFSHCERFYIDLSGKGEPLLNLSTIYKISEFCKSLSQKFNKDFVVSFVTNGMLLNKKTIKNLQKKNILFGISLDGPKEIHNFFRTDKFNNPTYDLIMKNIRAIKKREYLGCAITITNHTFDLLKTLLELDSYFETISIKPVRDIQYGFTQESIEAWIKEYEKLTIFFAEEIKNKRWKLLKKIINGDDYFGKFIFRCFLNVRVLNRCDAGITRFTIDENDKIYGCPASTIIPNQNIEFLNTKNQLSEQIGLNKHLCSNCEFFYYCGGECEIERILHNNKNNEIMCKYKKGLIKFAMYLKLFALFEFPNIFLEIYSFCQEKMNRKKFNED